MTHIPVYHRFLKSIQYAVRGLRTAWGEYNFRVQVVVAACAMGLAAVLRISRMEWLVLILVSILVLVLELLNTIFEQLTDFFSPRFSETARAVKDLMAGAVLVASIGAVAVGAFIFLPHGA